MKNFLALSVIVLTGILSVANAQYYNYNSTTQSGNGYNSDQYYNSSKGTTRVNTKRNYDGLGGYNSSTEVYGSGGF